MILTHYFESTTTNLKGHNLVLHSDWFVDVSRGSCMEHHRMLADPTVVLGPPHQPQAHLSRNPSSTRGRFPSTPDSFLSLPPFFLCPSLPHAPTIPPPKPLQPPPTPLVPACSGGPRRCASQIRAPLPPLFPHLRPNPPLTAPVAHPQPFPTARVSRVAFPPIPARRRRLCSALFDAHQPSRMARPWPWRRPDPPPPSSPRCRHLLPVLQRRVPPPPPSSMRLAATPIVSHRCRPSPSIPAAFPNPPPHQNLPHLPQPILLLSASPSPPPLLDRAARRP